MKMFKILLVEDELPIRDMVRFALSREGMEMLEAADTHAAHNLLKCNMPDLILLDWMLPEESGISLLKRLRKNTETRDIPVIMLTAKAEEYNKIHGFESGADDYITKPFSPKELMVRIKAVLRRTGGSDETGSISIGKLTLNTESHRVECNGIALELGPLEYRLLQFFLSHADRVFSRSQLLDFVWMRDAEVEERTVDVSIRRLRKVLGPCGCDDMIQTVRGSGYRFSENKFE